MFIVKKSGKYFTSGSSGWVNTSGLCSTPTWVADRDSAWGTSSKEAAEAVTRHHGGSVEQY